MGHQLKGEFSRFLPNASKWYSKYFGLEFDTELDETPPFKLR